MWISSKIGLNAFNRMIGRGSVVASVGILNTVRRGQDKLAAAVVGPLSAGRPRRMKQSVVTIDRTAGRAD